MVKPYYTLNNWIERQWQLTKDLVDKHNIIPVKQHKLVVPVKIINCPFCFSMHNIRVKPVVELMTRKAWVRDNKGCNQYTKHQFALYKKIMKKVQQQNI